MSLVPVFGQVAAHSLQRGVAGVEAVRHIASLGHVLLDQFVLPLFLVDFDVRIRVVRLLAQHSGVD